MTGLANSRWAPKESSPVLRPDSSYTSMSKARETTAIYLGGWPNSLNSSLKAPASELARYLKIVRRMKWKLLFLDIAYRRAIGPGLGAAELAEAELMFKLDFFEYYMLCERALVHLQGVFGISISSKSPKEQRRALGNSDEPQPTHRYHANVLEALDHEDNPLHRVLGVGNVRKQLAKAKDLRNRWKNVDKSTASSNGGSHTGSATTSERYSQQSPPPLAAYDLNGILTTIHEGFDLAYIVAGKFVAGSSSSIDNGSADAQQAPLPMDVDPDAVDVEQWSFMVEAMDWESV